MRSAIYKLLPHIEIFKLRRIIYYKLLDKLDKDMEIFALSKYTHFKISAKRLQKQDLIIPAIIDPSLPRTTSQLENLYSQIKHLLRRWSGTKQVLRSFEWAAQLATISQSLKETELFTQLLRDITRYEWIVHTIRLAKQYSEYRFQVHFANPNANKSPMGVMRIMDNLAIRDITS